MIMKRYVVVIEKTPNGTFSAFVPDLPGCITVGNTEEETRNYIKEAMELHLEGMKEDGDPIPEPTTTAMFIEV